MKDDTQVQIETDRAPEIAELHERVCCYARATLETAIRIGELLTEQKSSMPHGDFTAWIADRLPFTDRTARNYIRLHHERDRLKAESVSGLSDAYALLAEPGRSQHNRTAYNVGLCIEEMNAILDAPDSTLEHVVEVARCALEMQNMLAEYRTHIERKTGLLLTELGLTG